MRFNSRTNDWLKRIKNGVRKVIPYKGGKTKFVKDLIPDWALVTPAIQKSAKVFISHEKKGNALRNIYTSFANFLSPRRKIAHTPIRYNSSPPADRSRSSNDKSNCLVHSSSSSVVPTSTSRYSVPATPANAKRLKDTEEDNIQTPRRSSKRTFISFVNDFVPRTWEEMSPENMMLFKVSYGTEEYKRVAGLFTTTAPQPSRWEILKIWRVQNLELWGAYQLKVESLAHRLGSAEEVDEMWMFHGSHPENVPSICELNFDWRLHSPDHRYGRGVYFAFRSSYADHYAPWYEGYKTTFVARVLVGSLTEGDSNMVLPPVNDKTGLPHDTTYKPGGNEFVKYRDNEFYPAYVVYYKY